MSSRNYIHIGSSDMWDIYLKRIEDRLMLKRYTSLDYDYMQEYIDNNVDLLDEWRESVSNWYTEEWYDDWREGYEYHYDDYFTYDSDTDEYYDENDWDMTRDWFYTTDNTDKEEFIERVMDTFNEEYFRWNYERNGMTEDRLREIVWQYYDDCFKYREELKERNKPHWKVFNYYK